LSDGCSASLQVQSEGSELSVTYVSGSPDLDAAITVNVPRGMVVRLTVRPMVPSRYLEGESGEPPIFDSRMATLPTEIRDKHYIFDGASLVIESMVGALASKSPAAWQDQIEMDGRCHNWEDLVAKSVTVRPAGVHRSYDLLAQPARLAEMPAETKPWSWRQLANIDVTTQRWRFTGRPIYSWLNPTGDLPSSNAAIEQKWDSGGGNRNKIIAFEKESFFDRDDADADFQTMRLNPSGDTVLQSFPWEQPSATYFRHRLTIRSRYEGALASGQVAVQPVWGVDTATDGPETDARSWIRVAMLADRSRLQLTRPQLRALIPLTRAPATPDGAMAATPPVMAILDERPFAHGGLADRIAAEIRTGLGYVLPEKTPLEILDARKEFGPDPRLTYTPTKAEVASAMTLRGEGPVGLTFDDEAVRNPVFANTALILQPALMTKEAAAAGSLEEHFLSVGMRRYLDPSWLIGGTTSSHVIADPLWIGPVTDPTFTLGTDAAKAEPLIRLSSANGSWVVQFDSRQIDAGPQPSPADPYKILCTVDQGLADQLAFLHSPLEKGRASLSVFALPSGSTGDSAVLAGAGNQPLMMGGIEWQVAAGATSLKFGGSTPAIRLTSASPTTLMNWTRTGKNFDIWHTNDSSPIDVSDVVAQRGASNCTFFHLTDRKVLTFAPERSRYPNPLHVHRHHAVIATGHAQGIGRPVEIFKQVFRSFGGPLPALKDSQAVRLVEFETPARPFAWLPAVPSSETLSRHASVSFDLFSLLGDGLTFPPGSKPVFPPGFNLHIRILGGDATNKTLTGWTLTVIITKKDGSPVPPANLSITNPKPAQLVRGLLLKVAKGSPISCQAIYQHGETADAAVTPPTDFATGLEEMLSVTLSSVGMKVTPASVTELWADVSILTLPAKFKDGENFTFDWFFTGGNEQSPADAVTATALLDVVEAQARIISVSPPIPIVES
jgi:hypothetical protein